MTSSNQLSQVNELRWFIVEEILNGFGLPAGSWLRSMFRPLFYLPAQRFARLAHHFDQLVAEAGFSDAASWILSHFVWDYRVRGAENIPTQGPLLVVSNHPGAYDGLMILSRLPRRDVKLVVSDVPLTRGLPATSRHLIYVPPAIAERMLVVREMIRHLKRQGAVFIFGSGLVDPDPAFLPGAAEALNTWSPSLEIAVRQVPDTLVVPTIVSGVLSHRSYRNPLVRLQREGWKQRKLAEILQIIQQLLLSRKYTLVPQISFGKPFSPAAGARGNQLSMIIARAHQLLVEHQNWMTAAKLP
jgi:hypothetical protein